MLNFSGRVALVTGAGKGIGRGYAEWLAARGAKVVVNNRRRAGVPFAADEVVEAIRKKGGTAIVDEHAVEDEAGNHAMIETALRAYGRLDILICNAAITGARTPVEETPLDNFRNMMAINFFACVYSLQAALPKMIAQDYGRIILTSSAAGLYGQAGSSAYASSKTALIGLMRSVAIDNRQRNVRINIINPYARTDMAKAIDPKFSELMAPEKVAPVAGYLCSEQSTISGRIYAVGAGRVRPVSLVDGAVTQVDSDNAETVMPGVVADPQLFVPTSSNNSSLSLIPEIVAGR